MKADHLTFQRAAIVSVWGLLIQTGLGLVLLIYSVLGKDHAAMSAAIFVLLGAMAWLALAIVFDQHRRERLETMEADTLDAQSARDASAFTDATDVRVQAGRLAWMHKWLVPAVSIALGGALIVFGVLRFQSGIARVGFDRAGVDLFQKPTDRGWGIAVAIAVAVIGFIFARFVSGMAKQKVWANLRGGAAYAVGASLLGVLMLVSYLFDIAGTDVVLRYRQVIIPAFMVMIGAEVFVSFLLNLYRPRKPGDIPRPAFDSPVLSFVASPDRIAKSIGEAISYQVGVDVSGSWAYRLASRYALYLVLVGAGVLWLLTCFAVVGGAQKGLRIRGGEFIEELGPGLYVKAPWPFERIETHAAGITLGPDGYPGINLTNPRPGPSVGVILWTNEHNKNEVYSIVQASADAGSGSERDIALVKTEIPLVYTIESLKDFDGLVNPDFRDDYIKAVAQRQVWPYLATLSEDDLLGPKVRDASVELSHRIVDALKSARAGLHVVFTGIEAVHPPQETADKYETVVGTSIQSLRVIEDARAAEISILAGAAGSVDKARAIVTEIQKRNQMAEAKKPAAEIDAQDRLIDDLITDAGGMAGQLLSDAHAQRWAKHMGQRGRAEAYTGQLAAFSANPEYYKMTRYLDVLSEVLKNTRLYIVPEAAKSQWFNIDLNDQGIGGDVFKAENPADKN